MPDFLIWPAVALILGFFAMLLFKPAIDRKIAGITHASKDSLAFERSQEGAEAQPALVPFVELMKLPISPTAAEREQSVDKQLQSFGLKTENEKISVLVRALASTRIELEFNNIAHTIFGSQVNLLIAVAGTKIGITKQEADSIFEQAQNSYLDLHGNRKFDEWFAYLTNTALVAFNEDRIDITQYGKISLSILLIPVRLINGMANPALTSPLGRWAALKRRRFALR